MAGTVTLEYLIDWARQNQVPPEAEIMLDGGLYADDQPVTDLDHQPAEDGHPPQLTVKIRDDD